MSTRRSLLALLQDIEEAVTVIQSYIAGLDEAGYYNTQLVQDGVERRFIIVGEALQQLMKVDPGLGKRVTRSGKIIGFRNVLTHGYFGIDDARVWEIMMNDLPELLNEIRTLIDEVSSQS